MADEPGSAGAGNPGAGAPGAGAAAPPAGAAGSVDFSTYIPADIKDHPSLKSYDLKTPEGLGKVFKSLVSAQSMIGGEKFVVPKGANDNPDVWNRAYEALGRPKDHTGYQLGEGMKPGETPQAKAVEERFRKFAHDNGMNQKQFQALYGFFDGLIGESRKSAMDAAKAYHAKAVEALKSEWGDQFDNRIATANKVLRAFGGSPEEVKAFTAQFANNPVAIRILAEVGRRMSESALVAGDKADFDLGPADAKRKRMDIMTNPNNPLHEAWKSKRHPRKAEAMSEVERLSRIIAGEQQN